MAKLINTDTGKEINIGDKVETFRGEEATLSYFRAPHKEGSTGRVGLRFTTGVMDHEYFPSVINAKIVVDFQG